MGRNFLMNWKPSETSFQHCQRSPRAWHSWWDCPSILPSTLLIPSSDDLDLPPGTDFSAGWAHILLIPFYLCPWCCHYLGRSLIPWHLQMVRPSKGWSGMLLVEEDSPEPPPSSLVPSSLHPSRLLLFHASCYLKLSVCSSFLPLNFFRALMLPCLSPETAWNTAGELNQCGLHPDCSGHFWRKDYIILCN